MLKKDREALKKMVQSEQAKLQLEMLLEEVDSPDYIGTMVRFGFFLSVLVTFTSWLDVSA